ncbi:hypothetical protein [Sphingopyxis sp. JAI108]|uniref:hypothetical protein n=1 Tax=Sphingopyxis sp. JAI108 TaxID=2723060 RepID=UPI0015CC8C6B|nr:hypothetical protein [Sphingopyxis sp. JAI108]NYF30920.1 protein TonB [Sphingopyxis sp. JAI108]
MLQLSSVPATPYVEQLRIGTGYRALAISLAVLIPAFLLFLLLSFGFEEPPDVREESISVVSIEATEISEDAPEPQPAPAEARPASQQPAIEEPAPEPAEPQPQPVAEPKVTPIIPTPSAPVQPAPPRAAARPVYGPPDTGGSSAFRDTERVGTAPNGEPLYAAAWYREPRDDELRGYLSTASGPGWGLIACRTAPDFRVEDCVGLDEYPNGSQITRAVLAAAWAFRVRPPRLGGRPLVGAWVRIRIDYGRGRR